MTPLDLIKTLNEDGRLKDSDKLAIAKYLIDHIESISLFGRLVRYVEQEAKNESFFQFSLSQAFGAIKKLHPRLRSLMTNGKRVIGLDFGAGVIHSRLTDMPEVEAIVRNIKLPT